MSLKIIIDYHINYNIKSWSIGEALLDNKIPL